MTKLFLILLACFSLMAQAKEGSLAGNLTSVGSDTLGNLMALWGESFNRQYPGVNVQVQAAGSSTAPTSLAAGAAQIGAMSRPMQAVERQLFEAHYGYPPLAIPVALDALVVVVHQDNPLQGLDAKQLDAIFSVTRRCGSFSAVERWGSLGLTQPGWAGRSLQRFGRNSASGSWGFFKQQALCNGDFRHDVGEYPGSSAVVQAVAATLNAIGYASMGTPLSGVKMLPVSPDGQHWIPPDPATIRSGSYPFARKLYLYVNKPPGKPLEPLTAAFLHHVLSAEGQASVTRAGYVALSEDQLRQARQLIETH